jgi:hypothetical protein
MNKQYNPLLAEIYKRQKTERLTQRVFIATLGIILITIVVLGYLAVKFQHI